LTYILGISSSGVVDVTPRYVANQEQNKKARTLVSEEWLESTLKTRREAMWEM